MGKFRNRNFKKSPEVFNKNSYDINYLRSIKLRLTEIGKSLSIETLDLTIDTLSEPKVKDILQTRYSDITVALQNVFNSLVSNLIAMPDSSEESITICASNVLKVSDENEFDLSLDDFKVLVTKYLDLVHNDKEHLIYCLGMNYIKMMASYVSSPIIPIGSSLCNDYLKEVILTMENEGLAEAMFANEISTHLTLLHQQFCNVLVSFISYFMLEFFESKSMEFSSYFTDLSNTLVQSVSACSISIFDEVLLDINGLTDDKKSYKYIDDYKDLNSLAEQNGFTYIRSRGDHGIYRNKEGLTVVIPQGRTIGKGLSIKIQKTIDCKYGTAS